MVTRIGSVCLNDYKKERKKKKKEEIKTQHHCNNLFLMYTMTMTNIIVEGEQENPSFFSLLFFPGQRDYYPWSDKSLALRPTHIGHTGLPELSNVEPGYNLDGRLSGNIRHHKQLRNNPKLRNKKDMKNSIQRLSAGE